MKFLANVGSADRVERSGTFISGWTARVGPALCFFGLAVLTIGLLPLGPKFPTGGLDPSWQFALHLAFRSDFQFGKDLAFTYGPYGFLNTEVYTPASWAWLLAGRALLVGAYFATVAATFRSHGISRLSALVFSTAAATLIAGTSFELFPYLLASTILLSALGKVQLSWGLQIWQAAVLALLCLVKVPFAAAGVCTVLITSAIAIVFERRFPWQLVLFPAFILALWSLAGQGMANFPSYVAASLEFGRGYSDAMSADTVRHIWVPLAGTALLAAVPPLLVLGPVSSGQASTGRRLLVGGGLAVISFLVCKGTFVRAGVSRIAPCVAYVTVIVLYGVFLPGRSRAAAKSNWPRSVASALLIVGGLWLRYAVLAWSPAEYLKRGVRDLDKNLQAAIRLDARDRWNKAYEQALQQLRTRATLTSPSGSVDIYPNDQAYVFASGLPWRPRPVFQSYAAYTPRLGEMNRDALLSNRAARTIFFRLAPIDRRMPTLQDAASWPVLLSHYELTGRQHGFAVLGRRSRPGRAHFKSVARISVNSRQMLPLTRLTRGTLLWARVIARPTTVGALLRVLYKLPILRMVVLTRDGRVDRFRLIPAARAGFLLSPLPLNTRQFERLMLQHAAGLPQREVSSVMFEADGGPSIFWKKAVQVELDELRLTNWVDGATPP